jgi:hypothetical protein
MRIAFAVVLAACGSHLEVDWLVVGAPPARDAPRAVLLGSGTKLELALDTAHPAGALGGVPMQHVRLVEESVTGAWPTRRFHYRLHFEVDTCANARAVPREVYEARWPGPCDYPDDRPRPVVLAPYDLLLDREATRARGLSADLFDAACIPANGHGPVCAFRGTLAVLSDGTLTVNGMSAP